MLAVLGSTDEQRRALGEDYDAVFAAIEGVNVRQPLASLGGINHERVRQKRVGERLMDEDSVKKPRLV